MVRLTGCDGYYLDAVLNESGLNKEFLGAVANFLYERTEYKFLF